MYIFDLHCDTVYECVHTKQPLDRNTLAVSLENGARFDRWVQAFAIFMHDRYQGADARAEFDRQYAFLNAAIEQHHLPVFDGTVRDGCNVLRSIENAAFIGADFEWLESLHRDGLHLATLTWNAENAYAGGADSDAGLTKLGKQAAKKMEALGITLDVSHLSEKSFYDLLDTIHAPVIASHSNARALCDHRRNLSDDMLRAIAERGGIVGLNFYTAFLAAEHPSRTDVLRHAEHILNLCGETVPAIGSDFDGAEMPFDLKTQEDIEKLYTDMVQYFGKSVSDRIFYQNAADFFAK